MRISSVRGSFVQKKFFTFGFVWITLFAFSACELDVQKPESTVSSNSSSTSSTTVASGSGTSPFTLNGSDAYFSTGNVGIGTTTPVSKLEVSGGSITTATVGVTTLSVDFSLANVITTTAAAGTLVLNNMRDGTSYTLIVQNTGTYTLSGSSVATWRCAPACGSAQVTNASGHVLITVLKIGTTAYVSYITDLI
jgi:hypothetical protein